MRSMFPLLLLLCTGLLPAVELKPGEVAAIPFPKLPKTLAGGDAEMLVRLPPCWTATAAWPVFLWMNGGAGAPGLNAQLAGDLPFIQISLPLFKRPGAPPSEAALQDADGAVIGPAFRTMLAELDRLVPAIDATHSIIGGFSNGANCIKVLSITAPDVPRRFGGVLLNDGGVFITTAGGTLIPGPGKDPIFDVKLLRGRRLLGVGAERMAGRGLKDLCGLAEKAGVHATFVMMVGKDHSQVSEGEELKQTLQWIADTERAGIAEAQASLHAATAKRKWPDAVAAWRDLVRYHDPAVRSEAAVVADLALAQAACDAAAEKLAASLRSKDDLAASKDLRAFLDAWLPLAPAAVREKTDATAHALLAKALAEPSPSVRRHRLQKLGEDWHGYAIEAEIAAELEKLGPAKR